MHKSFRYTGVLCDSTARSGERSQALGTKICAITPTSHDLRKSAQKRRRSSRRDPPNHHNKQHICKGLSDTVAYCEIKWRGAVRSQAFGTKIWHRHSLSTFSTPPNRISNRRRAGTTGTCPNGSMWAARRSGIRPGGGRKVEVVGEEEGGGDLEGVAQGAAKDAVEEAGARK